MSNSHYTSPDVSIFPGEGTMYNEATTYNNNHYATTRSNNNNTNDIVIMQYKKPIRLKKGKKK